MKKYQHKYKKQDNECQTVYNLGKFPEYAMEDETKDCTYNG